MFIDVVSPNKSQNKKNIGGPYKPIGGKSKKNKQILKDQQTLQEKRREYITSNRREKYHQIINQEISAIENDIITNENTIKTLKRKLIEAEKQTSELRNMLQEKQGQLATFEKSRR
jgi:hypothetical protein